MSERLKLYFRRNPLFRLNFSEHLLPEPVFDIVVLPAELFISSTYDTPKTSVTAFIAYGGRRYIRKAFIAGCSDYLKEPWDAEELECRVLKAVEKKEEAFLFPWGKLQLKSMAISCPEDLSGTAKKIRLSYQEYKILLTLMHNRGQAVSRDVLYYTIWGKPAPVSSRVVDVHVSALRKELNCIAPAGKAWITAVRGIGCLIYLIHTAPRIPYTRN